MEIPLEIVEHELIKYLRVEEIFRLCRVNKKLQSISQQNRLWNYLLVRDFKMTYTGESPRQQYFDYYFEIKGTDIPHWRVATIAAKHGMDYHVVGKMLTEIGYTLYDENYLLTNLSLQRGILNFTDWFLIDDSPQQLEIYDIDYLIDDVTGEYHTLLVSKYRALLIDLLNGHILADHNDISIPYHTARLVYNYYGGDFIQVFSQKASEYIHCDQLIQAMEKLSQ